MSIQTELTRIVNAKAAIKTAIEGKGVTVPDATLLDGMASLIDSIEAGGGTIGGKKFISGNITFSETPTGKFTVEHEEWDNRNSGGGSNILVFLNGSTAPSNNTGALILLTGGSGVYITSNNIPALLRSNSDTISDSHNTIRNSFTINAEAAKKMLAGKTYTWMRVAYA